MRLDSSRFSIRNLFFLVRTHNTQSQAHADTQIQTHTQRTHTQVHTRTEARAHSPREGCKGDACPRVKTLQAGSTAWCRAGAEAQDAARGLRMRGGGAGPHDCASTQQDAYSGDVQDGASAALPSPPEVSRSRVTHFSCIFICLCQSLACN